MLARYDLRKGRVKLRGSEYSIDAFGRVKLGDENVPVFKDENGFNCVDVDFLGRRGIYRIVDLVAIHFKFMDYLPDEIVLKVTAFHIDKEHPELDSAKNVGYRFKDAPIEYPDVKGYYIIPSRADFLISKDGELYSLKLKRNVNWQVEAYKEHKNIRGGYRFYKTDLIKRFTRHRSMIMTFKEYADDSDKLLTNHINGVGGDDRLDNLEFITSKGNIDHAYKSGLRTQNQEVLARNAKTGEVTEYYSVAELGRQLNICHKKVSWRLKYARFGTVFPEGYQFKLKSDPRDWSYKPEPPKPLNDIKWKDVLTGKVYDTVKGDVLPDLIKIENRVRTLLREHKPALTNGYQVMNYDDPNDFPELTPEQILRTTQYRNKAT